MPRPVNLYGCIGKMPQMPHEFRSNPLMSPVIQGREEDLFHPRISVQPNLLISLLGESADPADPVAVLRHRLPNLIVHSDIIRSPETGDGFRLKRFREIP